MYMYTHTFDRYLWCFFPSLSFPKLIIINSTFLNTWKGWVNKISLYSLQ